MSEVVGPKSKSQAVWRLCVAGSLCPDIERGLPLLHHFGTGIDSRETKTYCNLLTADVALFDGQDNSAYTEIHADKHLDHSRADALTAEVGTDGVMHLHGAVVTETCTHKSDRYAVDLGNAEEMLQISNHTLEPLEVVDPGNFFRIDRIGTSDRVVLPEEEDLNISRHERTEVHVVEVQIHEDLLGLTRLADAKS